MNCLRCVLGVLVLVTTITVDADDDHIEVINRMTERFTRALFECRKVVNYTEKMSARFLKFWDENQDLLDSDSGCAFLCIMVKLHVLNREGKVDSANSEGFLVSIGADQAMTSQIVKRLKDCRVAVLSQGFGNMCKIGVEYAACFKVGIKQMGWTPRMRAEPNSYLRTRRRQMNFTLVERYPNDEFAEEPPAFAGFGDGDTIMANGSVAISKVDITLTNGTIISVKYKDIPVQFAEALGDVGQAMLPRRDLEGAANQAKADFEGAANHPRADNLGTTNHPLSDLLRRHIEAHHDVPSLSPIIISRVDVILNNGSKLSVGHLSPPGISVPVKLMLKTRLTTTTTTTTTTMRDRISDILVAVTAIPPSSAFLKEFEPSSKMYVMPNSKTSYVMPTSMSNTPTFVSAPSIPPALPSYSSVVEIVQPR